MKAGFLCGAIDIALLKFVFVMGEKKKSNFKMIEVAGYPLLNFLKYIASAFGFFLMASAFCMIMLLGCVRF